jgi:hypothetical protein
MLRDDASGDGDPAGGARRDRTDDLLLAKQALSQLSYGPRSASGQRAMRRIREPACEAIEDRHTRNREDAEVWWAWEDLNFRPHAYQARALTN